MNATTATDRRVKHKFTSEIYEPSMLLNIKLLYEERVYPLQTSRNHVYLRHLRLESREQAGCLCHFGGRFRPYRPPKCSGCVDLGLRSRDPRFIRKVCT